MSRIPLRAVGLLANLAVALMLVACQPAPKTGAPGTGPERIAKCERPTTVGECLPGEEPICPIKVSVDAQGKITVDPYILKLPAGVNKKQTIEWVLPDTTYVFASQDGPKDIKRTNGSDASRDHSNPGAHDNGKRFKIKFHPQHESQEWKYTMQLRKLATDNEKKQGKEDTVLMCDPLFNNQGN